MWYPQNKNYILLVEKQCFTGSGKGVKRMGKWKKKLFLAKTYKYHFREVMKMIVDIIHDLNKFGKLNHRTTTLADLYLILPFFFKLNDIMT